MFYSKDVHYVKATNEVFLERSLVDSKISSFMHGFMSMDRKKIEFKVCAILILIYFVKILLIHLIL